jgi:peptide-methionine (S)-S-oxide reductase
MSESSIEGFAEHPASWVNGTVARRSIRTAKGERSEALSSTKQEVDERPPPHGAPLLYQLGGAAVHPGRTARRGGVWRVSATLPARRREDRAWRGAPLKVKLVTGGGLVAAIVIAAMISRSSAQGEHGAKVMIGNPACGTRPGNAGHGTALVPTGNHQLAIFAQGCFWGVEERFRKVRGVVATAVGYTGGRTQAPTYEDVCSHRTGHAEAVLVEFDPSQVSYADLLRFFWQTHDPTSGDRQGPDRGSQYRSAIFTFGPEQQAVALASRGEEQKRLADAITTEIAPAGPFWVAEDHHQQWDEKHGALSCPVPHRPREQSRAAR